MISETAAIPAVATPIPVAHRVTPGLEACLPKGMHPDVLGPVMDIANRIAANPANKVLDPPAFYCSSGECEFSRGDILGQIYCCLKRVYQLTAEVNVSRDFRHGQSYYI